MANTTGFTIDTYINSIKNGGGGADVRQPIVNAMQAISSGGKNARTLYGHPAEDWLTVKELDTIYKSMKKKVNKDAHIIKGSKNLVMIKGLYEFFGNPNNYPAHS